MSLKQAANNVAPAHTQSEGCDSSSISVPISLSLSLSLARWLASSHTFIYFPINLSFHLSGGGLSLVDSFNREIDPRGRPITLFLSLCRSTAAGGGLFALP